MIYKFIKSTVTVLTVNKVLSRSFSSYSKKCIKIYDFSYKPDNIYKEEVMDLMANSFISNEPMSKVLKISYKDSKTVFDLFKKENLVMQIASENSLNTQEFSLPCKLPPIIGAVFGMDLVDYSNMKFQLPEIFDPIGSIISQLDNKLPYNTTSKGNILHASALATHPSYYGKNVGKNLYYSFLNKAKYLGYKYVVNEATSHITQKMQHKIGAKVIAEVQYNDFLYNGKYVFKDITDTKGIQLISLDLSEWQYKSIDNIEKDLELIGDTNAVDI
jgi:hypothetical protein